MSFIIKRLIPYLVPILTFICLELALAKPTKGWIFLLISLIIGLAGLLYVAGLKLNKKTAKFLLPNILYVIAYNAFFLLLVLSSSVFKHVFAALTSLLLGIALSTVFDLLYAQKTSRGYSNFFSYLNLLTVFMLLCSLGSLGIFLQIPTWILTIIAAVFSYLIFYSNYYASSFLREQGTDNLAPMLNQKIENLVGHNQAQKILYTIIPALIILEIFWALSFLPASFYVTAFIVTIGYYIISGLIKNRMNNNLNKKIIKKYLFVGGFCLLLVVLTARV